jgi:hypothetical protein
MGKPTSVEQRIPSENGLLITVLHKPADAVLRVAWCVQGLHGNAANVESLSMSGCPRHTLAVFPTNDLEGEAQLMKLAMELSAPQREKVV